MICPKFPVHESLAWPDLLFLQESRGHSQLHRFSQTHLLFTYFLCTFEANNLLITVLDAGLKSCQFFKAQNPSFQALGDGCPESNVNLSYIMRGLMAVNREVDNPISRICF